MRHSVAALTLLLVLGTGVVRPADDKETAIKKEMKSLEGTWELVSQFAQGKEFRPEGYGLILTIKDGKMTSKSGKIKEVETIKIDPTKKPKTIDFIDGTEVRKGIYELKGDSLKLCSGRPGLARPKDFSPKKGVKHIASTFKRVKP